jgi:hypothetical protein
MKLLPHKRDNDGRAHAAQGNEAVTIRGSEVVFPSEQPSANTPRPLPSPSNQGESKTN